MLTLGDLHIGQDAIIRVVGGEGELRHHLLDMGLTPGTEVTLRKTAPMGDPIEVELRGYELTLRLADAQKIEIDSVHATDRAAPSEERHKVVAHPGVGELDKAASYHERKAGAPIAAGAPLTFALAGNQNCGKTTLFNQLTGSNQHVGNFPGVTVDQKSGPVRGQKDCTVVDLPGIYSLRPYTAEEIVTRDFILKNKPDGIINIVDATNLERNLYLTLQLLTLRVPTVLALNMMDELTGNGGSIDTDKLSQQLGVPVVPICAASGDGVEALIEAAVRTAEDKRLPAVVDFCAPGPVHRCIHAVCHQIEDHAQRAGLSVRFAATWVIDGDEAVLEQLRLDQNEKELIEHSIVQMELERGLDRNAAIADMRYTFIEALVKSCVVKPHESKERLRSVSADKILTGKYTAIPIFIGVMLLIFYLTFHVIGQGLSDLLASGIDALTVVIDRALTAYHLNPVVQSLVIDGIFQGVGAVLSFLPIIVTLFFFLSILEDSGYMARVAFVMDKLLRKIGLSGKSIVPLLIGFGCTVPAVMATRTLTSERDRKMTILLTPFMSCTAKLPIYAFFVSVFFPGRGGLIMTGLYLFGIVMGILVAFLYRATLFEGEPVPFVMELPNYRLPGVRNVGQLLWEKAKDFLQKAFSVILVATVVVWFLQSFNLRLNMVSDSSDSMLAMIAQIFVPVLTPLGLGDWRIATALISGVMAKESVVSTLEVLFSGSISTVLSPLTAGSLLVFSLLYTPCIAAIASVKRELGSKWAVSMVIWQCIVAWVAAFAVYLIGGLF